MLTTFAGSQAPAFLHQLRIDEINVAYGYPVASGTPVPLEAESWRNGLSGRAHPDRCLACSGTSQVTGLGGGDRNAVTYRDVQAATAGDYRLELDTTAGSAASVSVSVNGAAPVDVPVAASASDVPAATAIPVTLRAGSNTVKLFSGASRGPGIDRIAVGPLPAAADVPKTTMTVEPAAIQWLPSGQQSVTVTAALRLDADDQLDQVNLVPSVPAGWALTGGAATAASLRLGQTLAASWTVTSPAGRDIGSTDIPVTASFQVLGRPSRASKPVRLRLRPADRVFMREAEDTLHNQVGSAGLTSCSACSGGQKVRNIGGTTDAYVIFDDVAVPAAGTYTAYLDFTVNGPHSYFLSVNGGAPVEVKVDGVGNDVLYTATAAVTLSAGTNTIKVFNDAAAAPDLDRLSLGR